MKNEITSEDSLVKALLSHDFLNPAPTKKKKKARALDLYYSRFAL